MSARWLLVASAILANYIASISVLHAETITTDEGISSPAFVYQAMSGTWGRLDGWSNDTLGIDLSLKYKTALMATPENVAADSAWAGDLDLGAQMHPFGRDSSLIVFSLENRQKFSHFSPAQVGAAITSLTGISDGVSGGPLTRVEKFWWKETLLSGRLDVSFGRLHFEDYVSDNTVSSKSAVQFQNEAFSGKPGIALPQDSYGAHAAAKLGDAFVLSGVIGSAHSKHNANFLDRDQQFTAVQAEFSPDTTLGKGHYRLAYWRNGTLSANGTRSADGLSMSFDQPISSQATFFMRYHNAAGATRAIHELIGGGFGYAAPFGRSADYVGAGVAYADPAAAARPHQVISEVFYRWQISSNIALTPSLQGIFNQHTVAGVDTAVLSSIRLRMAY